MKKSRFTEKQISMALRRAEAGTPVVEICRSLQITEQTFYRWKKKYRGLGMPEITLIPRRSSPRGEGRSR